MKKPLAILATFATFATLAMLTPSGAAFAASSVELAVKGLIVPTSCTPSLSRNGVVEHGKISAKDLKQDSPTILPVATLQLSVNCDRQTLFALRATDNRSESSTVPLGGFGLGLIDNTHAFGAYFLEISSAMADNAAARTLISTDEGSTWSFVEGGIWNHPDLMAFGTDTPTPMMIKDLLTDMRIHTRIEAAKDLPLSNEVALDGSATIEVKYL